MYNNDVKLRFLRSAYGSEDTIANCELIFNKLKGLEEEYNIDIYDFSLNQLHNLLRFLDRATLNSLGKDWSIIQKYVKWCMQEGYTTNTAALNIFRQDLKKFLGKDMVMKQFISNRDEFYESLKGIVNYQDQVVPVLVYEACRGQDFEEIKKLKTSDCNFNERKIVCRSKKGVRILTDIDPRSMYIIEKASQEMEYEKGNGLSDAKSTAPYKNNREDYVVKASIVARNILIASEDILDTAVIESKIRRYQKYSGFHLLNATNIFYSGMFERLRLISMKKQIEIDDYKRVIKSFGLNPSTYQSLKERHEHYLELMEEEKNNTND
jgi:hypothetical protein